MQTLFKSKSTALKFWIRQWLKIRETQHNYFFFLFFNLDNENTGHLYSIANTSSFYSWQLAIWGNWRTMSTIYSLSFNNSASLVLVEKSIGCVYITCMCACLCKTDPNVELYWYIHILWTHISFLSQMWEIFLFTKKKKNEAEHFN